MLRYTHLVKGIDPAADAFAGTVATDVVSLDNHLTIEFYVYKGVGATGTATLTIEACDDTVPTTPVAIPFRYQKVLTGDTHGEMIEVAAAGFATTAGSSQMYKLSVDAQALAALDVKYVRAKSVEVVNDPVLGSISIALIDARHDQAVQTSAID